jgi:hypothetical protein
VPAWWSSGQLKSAVIHTHQNMLYFLELASMLIANQGSPGKHSDYQAISLRSKAQALKYNLNVATSHLHMLANNQHTPKCLTVIMKQVETAPATATSNTEELSIEECQRKVDIAIAQYQSEEEAKKHAKDFVLPPLDTKKF